MHYFLRKSFPFLIFFCVCYVLFIVYKFEIYQWFCYRENNSASCFLAAKVLDGRESDLRAFDYYERSCELDYALACFELAFRTESQDYERAYQLYEKACELDLKKACETLQELPEPSTIR